jgi:hypothetical protein
MEDRWVIPLAVATMAGFLLGLLGAVLQLTGGSTLAVAVLGVVSAVAAAGASVLGAEREGWETAGLRALFAALMFVGIFSAMLSFLRDGKPLVALLWAVFAGVMAGLLVRADEARPAGESQDRAHGQPA